MELHDKRAVEPFLAGLKDKYVCWVAVEALGKLKDSRAVEPLIALLQASPEEVDKFKEPSSGLPVFASPGLDDAPDIRCVAARSLGQIGDPRAAEGLRKLLDDPNPDVVEIAQEALDELSEEQ